MYKNNQVINDDKFCYHNVGRVRTIWGAKELKVQCSYRDCEKLKFISHLKQQYHFCRMYQFLIKNSFDYPDDLYYV